MANKVVRIILVVVLFIVFFELGLFASYTIVTSEPPNVQGLIEMQVNKITSFFSPENVNNALIKDPTPINISNKKDVALKLEELSEVDGVNYASINVTTTEDTDNSEYNVTIEALGYASPNSTSGEIVISQTPSYKIIANAMVTRKGTGLMVDIDSISINSVLKLY
ncbi:hypothetical protein [Methanobrevibacter sp.]|uniref:hypothetical protein n=1 Tax=Methanobrevibacter sp. TaxID=66852 RepID=UPI0025E6B31B|nr:hypothetical protein [Methanobrevibacter sp.]MBQ2831329.1 hypothetical protein [Methanobrevibacter sp.]